MAQGTSGLRPGKNKKSADARYKQEKLNPRFSTHRERSRSHTERSSPDEDSPSSGSRSKSSNSNNGAPDMGIKTSSWMIRTLCKLWRLRSGLVKPWDFIFVREMGSTGLREFLFRGFRWEQWPKRMVCCILVTKFFR